MTDGDVIVERGAERLEDLAGRAKARDDGVGDVVAEELDASAGFLRRLKPSAISARIRRARGGGPSGSRAPIVIVGGALIAGMLLARLIDATTDDGD